MSSPPLYPLNIKTIRRQREQNLCLGCPRSPPHQSCTEAHKPSVCDVALGSGGWLETTTSSSSDHSSAAGSGRQHQSINLCLPARPLHKQGLTGPGNERLCPEIYRKLQLPGPLHNKQWARWLSWCLRRRSYTEGWGTMKRTWCGIADLWRRHNAVIWGHMCHNSWPDQSLVAKKCCDRGDRNCFQSLLIQLFFLVSRLLKILATIQISDWSWISQTAIYLWVGTVGNYEGTAHLCHKMISR